MFYSLNLPINDNKTGQIIFSSVSAKVQECFSRAETKVASQLIIARNFWARFVTHFNSVYSEALGFSSRATTWSAHPSPKKTSWKKVKMYKDSSKSINTYQWKRGTHNHYQQKLQNAWKKHLKAVLVAKASAKCWSRELYPWCNLQFKDKV